MMPQLGVMSQAHPRAAKEVFDKDCLVVLGTAIAATGAVKPGKPVMTVTLTRANGAVESHTCRGGEFHRIPLAANETAHIEVQPSRSHDVGAGRGKALERDVVGGLCGLILDARGRPLTFSADQVRNATQRAIDYEAMGLKIK